MNLRGAVAVTARLSSRDLGSAVREIQRRGAPEVALPADASIQYGGRWAEQQPSFRDLAGVLLAGTALVGTAAGVGALAPLALGLGSRATLPQPLAIAVIGGFSASAALLLLVLPPLLAQTRAGGEAS